MTIFSSIAKPKELTMHEKYAETIKTQEYQNYNLAKNQDCAQSLLEIKDIEIRLSALPNQILASSGTMLVKYQAQQKVLKEILPQKKANAISNLCYEEAKAIQETKKIAELDNFIADSNKKAEEQIVPVSQKNSNKTMYIGIGILLAALLAMHILTNKKK